MRNVAIVATAFVHEADSARDEVELIHSVASEALGKAGKAATRIGFVCSGSADLLIGRPFSFVQGLDGIGAWPPIAESHVEMDGAWALWEAWLRLQMGDIDAALVYCFGRPSAGDFAAVTTLQLDPYTMAPLGIDGDALANLQVSAMVRENAEFLGLSSTEPLPVVDGAAAVVLAAGDVANDVHERPAWIAGIEHRVEAHALGARDLGRSASTVQAAIAAGVQAHEVGTAHVTASHNHCLDLIGGALKEAGLREDATVALGPFTPMVTGLSNVCRAANEVMADQARASVAHASSGVLAQHNLVCVLVARG